MITKCSLERGGMEYSFHFNLLSLIFYPFENQNNFHVNFWVMAAFNNFASSIVCEVLSEMGLGGKPEMSEYVPSTGATDIT